ncbi:hypothetical protein J6590_048004 [Homalodisca vitripennis]|nr:hypothetical protein J6590_048004 [Homalodisca vitripennis]
MSKRTLDNSLQGESRELMMGRRGMVALRPQTGEMRSPSISTEESRPQFQALWLYSANVNCSKVVQDVVDGNSRNSVSLGNSGQCIKPDSVASPTPKNSEIDGGKLLPQANGTFRFNQSVRFPRDTPWRYLALIYSSWKIPWRDQRYRICLLERSPVILA